MPPPWQISHRHRGTFRYCIRDFAPDALTSSRQSLSHGALPRPTFSSPSLPARSASRNPERSPGLVTVEPSTNEYRNRRSFLRQHIPSHPCRTTTRTLLERSIPPSLAPCDADRTSFSLPKNHPIVGAPSLTPRPAGRPLPRDCSSASPPARGHKALLERPWPGRCAGVVSTRASPTYWHRAPSSAPISSPQLITKPRPLYDEVIGGEAGSTVTALMPSPMSRDALAPATAQLQMLHPPAPSPSIALVDQNPAAHEQALPNFPRQWL